MPYLYRHIRLDINQPFYIGIGGLNKFDNYKRAFSKNSRNVYWKKIVSKTNYCVEIVYESDDINTILDKEKEFIKLYGRKDLKTGTLANQTDGGHGTFNIIVSKETIIKRHPKISGKNAYWYGKKMTDE